MNNCFIVDDLLLIYTNSDQNGTIFCNNQITYPNKHLALRIYIIVIFVKHPCTSYTYNYIVVGDEVC